MEAVAIVGMGCRFPGALTPQSFWELLSHKGNAITEVPADRYDIGAYYYPEPATPGKVMSKYGGFLNQIDHFDAEFFGISPREAVKMDPQHRLLMEVAWEAMEDAGMVPASMTDEERVGLASFMGVISSDYGDLQLQNYTNLDVYSTGGSARAAAAGRIAYALNLNGSSFTIDAACSSSLICIDQAVHSLQSGAHTTALAGGVNIIINPNLTIAFSQGKMMASDGSCKAFDEKADGYVRSEGVGIVVLKLLSRALADGDRIHAVIRGSASCNDGQCDSFMAPSTKGQQAGLRKALQSAGVDPLSIDYVEAHGPGTRAGDPVEITTLGEVLCQERSHPLFVGSVKTNIGHTEGAAGVAGLIKTVLCLQHDVITPNLHFETPSSAIPWDKYTVKIPTELTPWPEKDTPHRAVVCGYGISGTNSYIVLEKAPEPVVRQSPPPSTTLLPLSARSPEALQALARNYSEYLNDPQNSEQPLFDLSYTASVRRHHHEHRLAVVSQSRQELQTQLQKYLQGQSSSGLISERSVGKRSNKVVWVFPGQGSQWIGMGRDLLEQEPVFRQAIEECDQVMGAYTDWSLLEQLQADEAHTRLNEIQIIQPTLFAIEVALARLWLSWGIKPDVVVGHSMGEVAAAYIAGSLSLEDAAWIICMRSKILLQASGKGAMAAVECTLEQAEALVSDYQDRVSVAVSNSVNSTVLSGDPETLDKILALLEKQNVFGRLVKVDVASHSPQMEPLREELLKRTKHIQPRQSTVSMFSTVKAEFIDGRELDASYWVQNLCKPVLFHTAIQTLLSDGYTVFMEMSPHPLLTGAIRQTIEQSAKSALALPSLHRDEVSKATLFTSLGKLYAHGLDISWTCLYPDGATHISLPKYPWQRKRYWNEQMRQSRVDSAYQRHGGHPILGTSLSSALHPNTYFWTTEISPEIFPFLNEHSVGETSVLPGSAYTELALAAATQIFGPQSFQVENVVLTKALFFPKGSSSTLQVILSPGEETGTMSFQLFSRPTSENGSEIAWLSHSQATIRRLEKPLTTEMIQYPSPEQVRSEWTQVLQTSEVYQGFRDRGMQHGPLFQSVRGIWQDGNQTMAHLVMPREIISDLSGYLLHPALLDSIQQAISPFLFTKSEDGTFLPVSISQIKLHRSPLPEEVLWSHASVQPEKQVHPGSVEGDITLLDEQGNVLLEILGFRLQLLDSSHSQDFLRQRLNRMLYGIQWEQQAKPVVLSRASRKLWLLFSEQQGIGQDLAAQIQAQGGEYILVTPGQAFRKIENGQYELHPTSPEDFQRLFAALSDEYQQPVDGIIYLWGLLAKSAIEDDPAYITQTSQDFAGVGMLHLIQAIAAFKGENTPRLWAVTRGVHAIEQSDTAAALLQAPLWGLGRVVVYEYPDMHCTLIDLTAAPEEQEIQNLFQEIWYGHEADEVALRQDKRYIAHLVRQTLPEERTESLFREDGTYLITGGLGGVGLRTAQWMIEQGVRNVVLMGRRRATKQAKATIKTLRAMGASVSIMQADVSQRDSLAGALASIRRKMPPLRGIFHSAVVLDDSTLLQMDRERYLGVMPPKVDGSWNLHTLTREDPLDYFVLFSSVASSLGSPGQGNYAAANAFIDALAFYRRQQNLPALSLNWGRWGEVGQAMIENRGERMDARGFMSMKPTEGLTILGSLLGQAPTQISAMSFSFAKWSQFFPDLMQSSFFAHLSQEEGALQNSDEELQMTREMLSTMENEKRQQMLSLYIEKQIAQVLGHPSIKLEQHQELNRLGIDSLMAVELKNRINADLGIAISAVAFLQGGPFNHLTDQIESLI